jgi:hypothetical protein
LFCFSTQIVPIALMGRKRQGKSTMLDFMERYLRHRATTKGGGGWLSDGSALVGHAFPWRHGTVGHTQGLFVCCKKCGKKLTEKL